MICMYATYSQKTGGDIEDVVELFDEGHPFRLLLRLWIHHPSMRKLKRNWNDSNNRLPLKLKLLMQQKSLYDG